MSVSFSIQWIILTFLALKVTSDCPGYFNEPQYNPADVTTCTFKYQNEICDSCCGNNSICCDNGTCIPFDPYCRFPTSCCKEPLCGDRCCSADYGIKCGNICAPKSKLICCDPLTGDVCPVGKQCCGSTCCDAGEACCNGTCCPKGEVCSSETKQCCTSWRLCNGKCCTDVKGCSNGVCCEPDMFGCGGKTCCAGLLEQTCSLGHCCPKNGLWCEKAGKCCNSSETCVGNRCCTQSKRCGSTCCAAEQICDNGNCINCAPENVCGDQCCSSGEYCYRSGNISQCITCNNPCYSLKPTMEETKEKSAITDCCSDNQICTNGTCSTCQGPKCGSKCCQVGDACSLNHCCPNGGVFCPTAGKCCDSGQKCSAFKCCNIKQYCDFFKCCADGSFCQNNICQACPTNQYACGSSCCDRGEQCINGQCKVCSIPCGNNGEECCNDGENCCNGNCCADKCCHDTHCRKHCWLQEETGLQRGQSETHSVITPSSFPCYTQLNSAQQKPCQVFPCLNKISSCSNTSYLMQMNNVYCNNLMIFWSDFTSEGQKFLNCASQCIAKGHFSAYGNGVIPCCNSMEQWGSTTLQKTCLKSSCDPSYCDVYLKNSYAFAEIFNNTNVSPFEIYFQYCNIGEK